MRIAIISNTTFNIYNFRIGLINHLISLGHRVYFVSPEDEYVPLVKAATKATYIELKSLSRKGYNPFRDLILCKEMYTIFRKLRINISLSFTIKPNIYSSFAGLFSGTKTILNMTGLGYVFMSDSFGNKVARTLYRMSLKCCDNIVFQNKSDQILLLENGFVKESKCVLINGSGISLNKYQKREPDIRPKYFTFLFIGRMLEDKGIRELIRASQSLWLEKPKFELHLVGAMDEGNPSSIQKEQMDRWLDQNVFIRYFGPKLDVIPLLQKCDAVVLPSYREGIPRVLLEAMAMRKPFITTRVPGCEDVTIENVNGLLCNVKSVPSLKAALDKMLHLTQEERDKMGQTGWELAEEKYEEKRIVKDYEILIDQISKKIKVKPEY